ncbi:hypothetical protein BH20ACT3_BH20ACT3_07770 [soil metagenome]
MTTDKSPTLAKTIRQVVPTARHDTTQYADNRVESDHGRLKASLRPMRGLQRDWTASVIIRGHAFMQTCDAGTTNSASTCRCRKLRSWWLTCVNDSRR